jgi:DNA invertase Pin-like site-specific DNA recombinase
MAKITIYLRVSTDAQDVANQKLGCLEYLAKNGWSNPLIIEDTASGKTPWQDRSLGNVIHTMPPNSILIVSEVSRLARSTLQVLEIMKTAAEKEISIHAVKSNLVLNSGMSSKIIATVLGLAAEIDREFISLRTKESLRRRKESGLPLGRPKGAVGKKHKLDDKADEIDKYIAMKINRTNIARLVGCTRTTLFTWLKKREDKKNEISETCKER